MYENEDEERIEFERRRRKIRKEIQINHNSIKT